MKIGIKYFSKRLVAYKDTLLKEGPFGILKRIYRYTIKNIYKVKHKRELVPKDFLFVSGCFLDNPHRFRCENQAEQLRKQGLIGDIIYFNALDVRMVDYYDIFIFYRLPISPLIKEFIQKAKKQNKLCIFDIDDLLFDKKYVKDRYELKRMTKQEREVYLDGVRRTNETIKLCDYGVTTTKTLAQEMRKYLKDVYIARNSMSDIYIELSEKEYEKGKVRNDDEIILGYASGSPSHDKDFEMIEDMIVSLLKKYSNLKLMIIGFLELSSKFDNYRGRIIRQKFVNWKDLPTVLNRFDINLAPSEDTLFNNSKSEIKFLESALLRIPTVASATNPFKHAIQNGKTSFLAENLKDWEKYISKLIDDSKLRKEMGEAAYEDVLERYNTQKIGSELFKFIMKHKKIKVSYVLPSLFISGGNIVSLEHVTRLQRRGLNTSIIIHDESPKFKNWFDLSSIPIITVRQVNKSNVKFDRLVATMWSTLYPVLKLNAKNKYYLVQGKEHLFYKEGSKFQKKAKETYKKDVNYLTVSKWCKGWLKEEFGKTTRLIPNGLNLHRFKPRKRSKLHKPVRILVEGSPEDAWKNIDEAFKVLNKLKIEKEVWFVSYSGEPKDWYKYDKYFNRVPYEKMPGLYYNCDILLKTSYFDSFSYPPLEMMATGGVCVVAENEGGMSEYIKDNYNCLTYKTGEVQKAVKNIKKLILDEPLRRKLIAGGLETARKRDWKYTINILEEIYISSGKN